MKNILILQILSLFILFVPVTAHSAKIVNIGIVTDGPVEQAGWSPELFVNELKVLTKGEFDVQFPLKKQLDGGWNTKNIRAALQRLQDDPSVDMVLALGYVSSSLAAMNINRKKPTFSPLVMDAKLMALPRKGNSSGVRFLNYLTGKADFVQDLAVFRNIVSFKNLTVLIEKTSYSALPGLIEQARKVAKAADIDIRFVLQTEKDENLAEKMPPDTDAVILTSLPRQSKAGMQQLIQTLISKRLPSFNLMGTHLVEQGVLMAESPTSDWPRIARRNALNMHAVMRGELTSTQPILFEEKRRLTINMATARAIGLSPRLDVLTEAILLNEEPEAQGRKISLSMVALDAVKANLDLKASSLGLQAGETIMEESNAKLFPSLSAGLNYTQIDNDSAMVNSGAFAEKSTTAALTLNQLIYADKVNAEIEIQEYLQNNRQALSRQLELDIVREATVTYLNVLKAQTLIHVQKDNLNLTRKSLEIARDRWHLGVASPAEGYRWESELATSRRELLAAQSRLRQAKEALNRILHRPLKEQFVTQPATLDDPNLLISRKELFDFVNNDKSFNLLADFLVIEGLNSSPELNSIKAIIASIKRELKTNKRSYWSPVVTLQGEVFNVLQESRSAGLSSEGTTDWRVGLNVSLPLYEGGGRSSRVSGTRFELNQHQARFHAIKERIEQNIRNNMHAIRASHPSIQLSQEAEKSARKNLDLVVDSYSRGAISILDLLDAQNSALIAEESAANAVFDFLIDLMNLERSTGHFDFLLGKNDRDDLFERLKLYIATEGKNI